MENLTYVDEVEKVEREIMEKDVRNLLKYLYANQIEIGYRNSLELMCNGCITQHPSQSQHSCFETFDIVDGTSGATVLFIEAAEKVCAFNLKLLFIESCKILWMDSTLVDFDQTLQKCLQSWIACDFEEMENMIVDDSFSGAYAAASTKIGLLEKRFTE